MKILITGAKGFVGKNLTASLENIRDGKDCVHTIKGLERPSDLEIYAYDIDSTQEDLERYCQEADFVFNLAGVNRPKDQDEFMKGNFGFASTLLNTLKRPAQKYSSIGSQTCLASGAGPTITPRWPPSATTWPMICLSRSMTAAQSWISSI